MPTNTHVFPEHGDPNDAELFAQLAGQANSLQYVETGLDISPQYGLDEIDITEGVCYLEDSGVVTNTNSNTLLTAGYCVQVESQTITLPYSGDNYVFVEVDRSASGSDNASVEVYSDVSNAGAVALQIGYIDTLAESHELHNRDPSVTAETMTVTGDLSAQSDVSVQGVLDVSDLTVDTIDVANQLGIPVYSDPGVVPAESHFWDDTEQVIKYKDGTGTVHSGGGELNDDSTFVTVTDEDLPNSTQHAALTGSELHTPKEHGNSAHSFREIVTLGPNHHIAFESGLDRTEVARFDLVPGETFDVDRISLVQAGGGSTTDAKLELYDQSAGVILESAFLGETSVGGATSSDGATLLLRMTQQTGSQITATPTVVGRIQD